VPYPAFLHSHVSSWAITIVLFFISYLLLKKGNEKGQKITHMILRLFFVLTVITGAGLIYSLGFYTNALIKGALALWLIFLMEFILVRTKKGTIKGHFWIQFVIALVLVFYFGYFVLRMG